MKGTPTSVTEFDEKLVLLERSINQDPAKAKRKLTTLRRQATEQGASERIIEYCNVLIGRCYLRLGRNNDALKMTAGSTQKLDMMGAGREAATGYHFLSQIHTGRHDIQSAMESCLRGLEIAKQIHDWYLRMNLTIDMCSSYRFSGDWAGSISHYLQGLDIYYKHVKGKDERIKGQEEYTEFVIGLNIGVQYLNTQNYAKAKEYFDKIGGSVKTVLRGAYTDLYNLEYARTCFGTGELDMALERSEAVITALDKDARHSLHGASINYLGLSGDLVDHGKLEMAGRLIELIRPAIEREDAPKVMAALYMVLGTYHDHMGDKDESIAAFKKCAKYNELKATREYEDNRVSLKRRLSLQQALDKQRREDETRMREMVRLKQEMEFKDQQEEMLLNISENTDSFFLLYNPAAASVDFASKNGQRLFGLDAVKDDALLGRILGWLGVSGQDQQDFVSGRLTRRVSENYETRNQSTGEPMTVHMELIPSRYRQLIMVLTDVTKIMRTQASLMTAIDAAQQASAAKTAFLSNMSHDIRTPINAVMGLLAMLEENLDKPDMVSDCITQMHLSSRHLLELINDMLDMSRIEAGRMLLSKDEFSMPLFLDGVMAIMRPQAAAREQSLTLDSQGIQPHTLIGDPLRLRQVFLNILSNLVKFTKSGGHIALQARQAAQTSADLASYEFVFQDNGCGIAPEFIQNVFKPFERAEREVRTIEGSGLGMAITKNIVDMMGGSIEIASELGKGTTFTLKLSLPLKEKAQPNAAGETRRKPPAVLRARRSGLILLVEDNALNSKIARYQIEKLGYRVDTVTDGQQAVDAIANHAPGTYDLVFMDVRMPVLNGYEATQKIRLLDHADAKDIPIVAMTADAFSEDVRKAKESGMNGHLAKPIDVEALKDVLTKYAGDPELVKGKG